MKLENQSIIYLLKWNRWLWWIKEYHRV